MPEQPEQPKSPVLRLSQKKLTEMFESGEAQIPVPKETQSLITSETKAWETFLGKKLKEPIPSPSKDLLRTLEKAKDIGWTVRPNDWYWKQIYEHDPFGQMISHLRKEKKIQVPDWCKDIPEDSRFGISNDELQTQVNPAIATLLGVQPEQVRLPKAIEFNILGNMNHPEWEETGTWEWFEDKFEGGDRLVGGGSGSGGLVYVDCNASDSHRGYIGFRSLVAFSPSTRSARSGQ